MALSTVVKKKSSSSLLAPGFRFHPTDEELVRYYLRRKVCGKGFLFDAISDVDIYKAEPWDLPSFSKLKTRDLEWYFFSVLDKKYGNGARTNRATEKGYWKTTGKDRAVYHKTQIVGMKKTLVYHIGRAPKGQRTNWVMHEYRLADLELVKAGIIQDAFVLCRVFQKSGSGPKNGEQYGAPFVDEEWENDEFEFFPNAEVVEEVDFGDDAYVDGDDLQQILASADVPYDVSPPLDPKPANGKPDLQTAESVNDTPNPLLTASEQYCEFEQQHEMDAMAVKHEHVGGESSKSHDSSDDLLDYLLDEPFVDAPDGLPYSNGGFLEANDLTNPVDNNNTSAFDMLEEYLTFFDAIDNNTEQFVFDPSLMLGTEDLVSDRALVSTEDLNDGNEQSDVQYPFFKKASQMLSGISAPPAFASEFPSKDAVLRLNSLSQPSSSVRVTAGMIQISSDRSHQPLSKSQTSNIVLSFGFSLESSLSVLQGKTAMAISRSWFYFVLFWVLVLSVSFKIGTCICAR